MEVELMTSQGHLTPATLETPRRPARGFSLIEVMIAAGVLLIIALGLLPLFTRAIVNNQAGNEYTQVSNHGKSRVETLFQLPFGDVELTVPDGSTELVTEEYWLEPLQQETETLGSWETGPSPDPPPAGQMVLWTRTTTIRQYSVNALDDGELTIDEALDGGTDPIFVHLKEIQVQAESPRIGGPLAGGKQVLLRMLKAK